jgi:MFS family permease
MTRASNMVNIISFLLAAVLIGVDVYMPIYIQNVLGFSPTVSGLALISMTIAWLVAAVVLGRLIITRGGKQVTVIAVAIMLLGMLMLPTMGIQTPLMLVVIYVAILGFGFGGALTTLTILIQESVGYGQRGAATATNTLLKTLGQTIGVSIFGGVFNLFIVQYFSDLGLTGVNPSDLYGTSAQASTLSREQVVASLNHSLHLLFILIGVIVLAALVLSLLLPGMDDRNKED